jgi:hypothetical protein
LNSWPLFSYRMNAWVRIVGTGVACLLVLGVAVRAAAGVSGERARRTLDGLLVTPLSTAEILSAKALGSLAAVRWAWAWLGLIVSLALFSGGLSLTAVFLLALAWLVYAGFAAVVGLYFSVVCRGTVRAMLAAVLAVLVVTSYPWLLVSTRDLIRDPFRTWLDPVFRFGPLLSPPYALYGLASRTGAAPRIVAVAAVWLGYAVAAWLVWRRTCHRFDVTTGRAGFVRPLKPPYPAASRGAWAQQSEAVS